MENDEPFGSYVEVRTRSSRPTPFQGIVFEEPDIGIQSRCNLYAFGGVTQFTCRSIIHADAEFGFDVYFDMQTVAISFERGKNEAAHIVFLFCRFFLTRLFTDSTKEQKEKNLNSTRYPSQSRHHSKTATAAKVC